MKQLILITVIAFVLAIWLGIWAGHWADRRIKSQTIQTELIE